MTLDRLYDPLACPTAAVNPRGKSHLIVGGEALCGAPRPLFFTLDAQATCGWCRLIEAYKEDQ